MEYYPTIKMSELLKHRMDEPQLLNYAKWKKLVLNGWIYYKRYESVYNILGKTKAFIWIAGVMVIPFAFHMEQIHHLHIKYASMFFLSLTYELWLHSSTWPQHDCKHKYG